MSYEQFIFLTKFAKNLKFQSDLPPGKMLGEFFDEKGVSAPQKLSYFFKTKWYQKQWFQDQKLEKYIKSKNALKSALGAFNQEIWAI